VTGLAIKHRPRRLADLVGQRHVTAVLQRALQSQRVPHQLLFSGGSGLGKTTVARVVAAALLCENPVEGDACGACESCLDIFEPNRSHPDVVEFDAASNGQKEQIRELAARALTSPVRGEYRVYIIDEAHGLSQGGGQAFLKLLEEPPAHVVFMLATTDPEKMLKTNRGRCVEFELARPSDEELAEHLRRVAARETWELTSEAALAIVRATDPALGVRGLLMTLEKLQEALAWGEPLELDDVTSLLGLPPASLIERLWAAVLSAEKNAALDTLTEIRTKVSDASLRKALVIRSRDDLAAALAHGGGEVALWRFEQLLEAPSGALWTDMVVAKIARTDTPGDPVIVEALLRDALATARQLTDAVEQPTARRSPLELLADAVSRRDVNAAALLEQCQLSIVEREDQQHAVRISAPEDVVVKLREHAQAVRDAAAECDLALLIAKN
jgi:DNA polymerase III subunit gamma/tau